ncbi:hypothetical protein C0214_27280 (plasmid) [Methylobacterium sp. DM1]|nr:hypothetical protein C0214_27280 [Methylobacterium sp. DM1]
MLSRPSPPRSDAEDRHRIISELLTRTAAAEQLDEDLWAMIVTRSFGHPDPAIRWLEEDELRLLGGLDACLALIRANLPGWRVRLVCNGKARPRASCDRWGHWPGPSEGATEGLALCAALLRGLLSEVEASLGSTAPAQRRTTALMRSLRHYGRAGSWKLFRPWPLITGGRGTA